LDRNNKLGIEIMKVRIGRDLYRRASGALLALPLALAAHYGLAQGVTDDMLLNAQKEPQLAHGRTRL
jgi:hypothetical protein